MRRVQRLRIIFSVKRFSSSLSPSDGNLQLLHLYVSPFQYLVGDTRSAVSASPSFYYTQGPSSWKHLRLVYVLPSTHPTRPTPRKRGQGPTRLMIVLGSGGHTAEMLALLRNLDTRAYTHRSYVVSEGDDFSAGKAAQFEASLAASPGPKKVDGDGGTRLPSQPGRHYDIAVVPRARKIHQSLLTTPVSATWCLIACFRALYAPAGSPASRGSPASAGSPASTLQYPDLILTNGPGTAVCVVYASVMLRYVGARGSYGKMRTIYVESWARVTALSLSGRLLLRVVDRFFVQWEEALKGAAGRAEYIGVLV
ncbi:MAG: UDP-N-acetylglucosamine transferase subunit [Lichina confinis]|nr:MAG: UDP-N-acetylglucosamine transferase subunit [Lichina confinis]